LQLNSNKFQVKDKKLTEARLALVLSTKIVFENCMRILGISLPKKM